MVAKGVILCCIGQISNRLLSEHVVQCKHWNQDHWPPIHVFYLIGKMRDHHGLAVLAACALGISTELCSDIHRKSSHPLHGNEYLQMTCCLGFTTFQAQLKVEKDLNSLPQWTTILPFFRSFFYLKETNK